MRRLIRLAYNLRWTWEAHANSVFERLAPETWRSSHNSIAVLRALAAGDVQPVHMYSAMIDAAADDLERYLGSHTWGALSGFPTVAYFCAEFAVAECLPIYSGGLGVLAGDYLKTASDMGLPAIGVGLLYRYGYFRQSLDAAGRQTETYERIEPSRLPLRPVLVGERSPLRISIAFPQRQVYARAWRADVGRNRLYLLDTNLAENTADDRLISGHLYGGDEDTRLRQEIVLGIGGVRLIRALQADGLEGDVRTFHLNEGHSAMLVLELAHERLEAGYASCFADALEQVAPSLVFTTHTAELAGQDTFSASLLEAHLGEYRRGLGLSESELMAVGRLHPHDSTESFNMTVLAMRGASRRNGVSDIHARISGQHWRAVGVGVRNRAPLVEMEGITNGVHAATWVGPEMASLFDGCLGPFWRGSARMPTTWAPIEKVPIGMLWNARTAQRARLIHQLQMPLDPANVLVIGFARRFAAYKRAELLLRDSARLARLLAQPVIIVFAGKAHPRDEPGKLLVQRVVEASRDAQFGGRIVFLADYGLELARLLVQGSDVWLNTPRRPHEACGTSGMKAVLNGAVHLSELDGWWEEAYRPEVGWALGADLPADVADGERDNVEAGQLMDVLELQIVPLFLARDATHVPRQWLELVQRSIARLAPHCSAERMLVDYANRVYAPSSSSRPVSYAAGDL